LHGKEGFAVLTRHGKECGHGKRASERMVKNHAWQRRLRTHGKDTLHGKEGNKRTTKRTATTKASGIAVHLNYAVRPNVLHGKENL
jgi:hypothetical protein